MTTACDPAATRRLLDTLGDDARPLLREMIDAFCEEGPTHIEAMREGLAVGDAPLVRRGAHTLKSNAAQLGVPDLEATSRELEILARDGHLDQAGPVFARVAAGFAPAVEALNALAHDLGLPPAATENGP